MSHSDRLAAIQSISQEKRGNLKSTKTDKILKISMLFFIEVYDVVAECWEIKLK